MVGVMMGEAELSHDLLGFSAPPVPSASDSLSPDEVLIDPQNTTLPTAAP